MLTATATLLLLGRYCITAILMPTQLLQRAVKCSQNNTLKNTIGLILLRREQHLLFIHLLTAFASLTNTEHNIDTLLQTIACKSVLRGYIFVVAAGKFTEF